MRLQQADRCYREGIMDGKGCRERDCGEYFEPGCETDGLGNKHAKSLLKVYVTTRAYKYFETKSLISDIVLLTCGIMQ